MSVALITGSAGLIGSETARLFASRGLDVVGIDNDMRGTLFGPEASTAWSRAELERTLPNYSHVDADIRDTAALEAIWQRYGTDIAVVVHTAAQPSHDWAARDPHVDFSINATGTLNLLDGCRRHSPDAAFIFTSSNKVYGDTPNRLPLVELESRWELDESHPFAAHGIPESMTIDASLHSLMGASKVAADVLVQEYGRYFGMNTVSFRGGCLTGPGHSGTQLHGFLAYLVQCAMTQRPYTVFGYQAKQVRDNIHSRDLVEAFWQFFESPRAGVVYNIGGGRSSNCSMLEAIAKAGELAGRPMEWSYEEANRIGDHIWYISDLRAFQRDYPGWSLTCGIDEILAEIHAGLSERLAAGGSP
jgi:CDP-paratose 2-epimerase